MNQQPAHAQTELWETSHEWLSLTGNSVNKKFCREEIGTHPDYPALTSLTDFLDSGGMEYNAVQADASYIHEFNYPLLAHIKEPGQEYVHIIGDAASWETQKDITRHWSGICIFPEKGTRWVNTENDAYQQRGREARLRNMAAAGLALALFVVAAIYNPSPLYIAFGALSLAGLVISILTLGTELGVQNSLVKQVCGAVSKGGCDKVLKSTYSKGIAGFTTGDIASLYFAAQYAGFLYAAVYPALFSTLVWVSLPGLLVAAWSVYTQSVKIKQWCALCLGIAAVLVLQFLVSGYISFTTDFAALFNTEAIILYAGIALLISLFFLPVKKLLKTNNVNQQKLAELKKWKMDAGIFSRLLSDEENVDVTIWENDLLLGNAGAPVKITVACNPYCGPCALAHTELDKILEKYKDKVCLQVRFLCKASDPSNERTKAVTAILRSFIELKTEHERKLMLSDWFSLMDYDKWMEKWKPVYQLNVQDYLQQHENWVNESNIMYTPTFFVNGKKMSGRYELGDFAVLIPQLSEIPEFSVSG